VINKLSYDILRLRFNRGVLDILEGGPGSGRTVGSRYGHDMGRIPREQNPTISAPEDRSNLQDVLISREVSRTEPNSDTRATSLSFKLYMKFGDEELKTCFKPKNGECMGRDRQGNLIIPRGEKLRNFVEKGTFYKREILACVIDRTMGLGLVPDTDLFVHPEKGIGSAQRWIKGINGEVEDRNNGAGAFDRMQSRFAESHVDQVEKLFLLDTITGNSDRHGNNIMIDEENGKLHAIDNGLCIPQRTGSPYIRISVFDDFKLNPEEKPLSESSINSINKLLAGKEKVFKAAKKLKMSAADMRGVEDIFTRAEALKTSGKFLPRTQYYMGNSGTFIRNNRAAVPHVLGRG